MALPIPGYDTLAASQVVERLPSLSRTELEGVRAYESATRRRRTVLHRIAQLLADPAEPGRVVDAAEGVDPIDPIESADPGD